MPMVKQRLIKVCELLEKYALQPVGAVENLLIAETGYKKGHTPPDGGYEKCGVICGADKHFWIRGSFRTPSEQEGFAYILGFDFGFTGRDMMNPQGLLYLNGEMVQGIDLNHMETFLQPDTDYRMDLYLYTAAADRPFFVKTQVARRSIDVDGLYFDMVTPLETLDFLNENTAEYRDTLSCLEQAANLIDERALYSDSFYKSVRNARAFLQKEFYGKLCSTEGKPVVHCIGHTHIDVEWRWERNQTREKVQRSIATVLSLMEQYPEYRFTMTQPELYRYLKEEAPEKYEKVRALAQQGRWEPEGAMWVECDCNLVSGESFVRQLLYGKEFFKEQFDKESRVLFLPDVFGYSAALPQIMKKSGVDYFVTSKISWNETNTMPYDSFLWKGIDGTEIFSSFITTQPAKPNHETVRYTGYSGIIEPSRVMGAWDRYQQKEFNKNVLLTYGYGDGGGGPTRQMLERQRRLAKGLPGLPVTKLDFLLPYLEDSYREFTENSRKLLRAPKWVGELYLEYHRGTYTTMAKNKRANRKAELLLQKAEAMSYDGMLRGGSYDGEGLKNAWKTVLHDQFHDILPGTSIKEVYAWTEQDYANVEKYCGDLIGQHLQDLAENVAADKGVLVYNGLGFARGGQIRPDGKTVELTEEIPAFGWKVITPDQIVKLVYTDGLTVENSYYRMTLDETGAIASLWDKTAQREVLLPGQKGNVFSAYEDQPYTVYEAWDIGDYYRSKQYVLDAKAKITPIEDGSRSGFMVEKTYMDSTLQQKIWLYSRSRRIDFETEIQWHQKHQLLKVAFPLDIHTDSATYEIQYGHVTRPTHQNTSWDSARFEVCAHKWVDLSEHGYGVSLLNDCKYGYSANGSTLELTALKRPTEPNPDADEGKHVFTYALLPHAGSLQQAGVIREAYSLNQPLDAVPVTGEKGNLPQICALVSCDADNVVIETVKKAQDGDSMILRLYEAFDSRGTVTLKLADGFREVWLCNLMEKEERKLDFDGKNVKIPVKNFEIITLKCKR